MLQIVWEYHVKPEQVAEFERLYGEEGPWIELFRRQEGFIWSTLLQEGRHYLTIDCWRNEEDFQAFKQAYGEEYSRLDSDCARLLESERLVGNFDPV